MFTIDFLSKFVYSICACLHVLKSDHIPFGFVNRLTSDSFSWDGESPPILGNTFLVFHFLLNSVTDHVSPKQAALLERYIVIPFLITCSGTRGHLNSFLLASNPTADSGPLQDSPHYKQGLEYQVFQARWYCLTSLAETLRKKRH